MAEEQVKTGMGAAGKAAIAVLVAIVVALGVFAALLFASYQRIAPMAERLAQDGQGVQDALDACDGDALVAHLEGIDEGLDAVASELGGGVWDVAQYVPVLGGDVTGARQLVAVAQDVMASTVMPFSDAVSNASQVVMQGVGAGLADAVSGGAAGGLSLTGVHDAVEALSGIDGALDTLRASQGSLAADAEALDALGDFHFDELNEARDTLREVVGELADVVGQVEPALEGYGQAKDAVSSAAQAAGEAVGTAVGAASGALDAASQALDDAVEDAKQFGQDVKGWAETALGGLVS